MKKIIITILTTVFLSTIYACAEPNNDRSISIDNDNPITSENSGSLADDNPITSENSNSIADDNDNSINTDELLKKYNDILTYYDSEIMNQYELANSYSHNMYLGSDAQYSAELTSIENEEQSAYVTYEKQKKAYYTQYRSYGYDSAAAQTLAEREARANYNATISAISARKLELSTQWENRIKYNECMERIEELKNERDTAIQELFNTNE